MIAALWVLAIVLAATVATIVIDSGFSSISAPFNV